MAEISDQLTEKAARRFNESLDLIQAGRLEEALESLQNAEKAAYEAENDSFLLHTLKLRGQILESLSRLQEALKTYTFALRTNEEFLETDPENELYQDLLQMNMNNIGNLGNTFRRTGNFQSSKQSYEIGLEICRKRLEAQPDNDFYQMYLGNTLNNRGELLAEMGQIEKAREDYEKALYIYEKLLLDYPSDLEYLSDTVMTLNNLGALLSEKGQTKEAKENFEKALDILESLRNNFPENMRVREELNLTRGMLEEL